MSFGFLKSFRFYLIVLLLITIGYGVWFVQTKRDTLSLQFTNYVADRLRKTYGLNVDIGRIEGDVLGTMSLRDVRVTMPSVTGPVTVFGAETVEFRYTLTDLFREKFSSWFDVVLIKPVFYMDVSFPANKTPSEPQTKTVEMFSKIVHRIRNNTRFIIEDGTIAWKGHDGIISGIEGMAENKSFDFKVALNHIPAGPFDLTSTLRLQGRVQSPGEGKPGSLKGTISTEGTVINWKPMTEESHLEYELEADVLRIKNTNILSGIKVEGSLGHTSRQDVDLKIIAVKYPLAEVYNMLTFSGKPALGHALDAEINIKGSIFNPQLQGQIMITNEEAGVEKFKNMQLSVEGIYPRVKLSQSRVVMKDGSVMNFSNQEVHVRELLKPATYERLISHADQTAVAWGDWRLLRKDDEDSVLVEHEFSDGMKVRYERFQYDESRLMTPETENEMSLDYQVGDQEHLKVGLKDEGEGFFGMESRRSF